MLWLTLKVFSLQNIPEFYFGCLDPRKFSIYLKYVDAVNKTLVIVERDVVKVIVYVCQNIDFLVCCLITFILRTILGIHTSVS